MNEVSTARRIWAAVEPVAASIYFVPEVHRAYNDSRLRRPERVVDGIEYPDMLAYFTSRGACLGDGVSGHLVAAAFGVFKRPMVVDAVAAGWQRTDQAAILDARQLGAVTSLRRMLGDAPAELSWVTEVLRIAGAAPGEGRALFSGLLSLGMPDDPMGAFWRAADLVREHRGDSHIAAWIDADLDACEIGVLTDPWRGQPLKSWVRSRGWTDDELDGAIERLTRHGYLDGDGDHAGRLGPARADRVGDRPHGGTRRRRARRRRRPAVRDPRPLVRADRRRQGLPDAGPVAGGAPETSGPIVRTLDSDEATADGSAAASSAGSSTTGGRREQARPRAAARRVRPGATRRGPRAGSASRVGSGAG